MCILGRYIWFYLSGFHLLGDMGSVNCGILLKQADFVKNFVILCRVVDSGCLELITILV